jgi:hypothetical protein
MFAQHQPQPPPIFPRPSFLCALRVSAFSSLSCFTLSLFCKKPQKLNPLLSYSSALFQKEYFDNSFSFNHFRTLLQNTGGDILQAQNLSYSTIALSPLFATLAGPSQLYENTTTLSPVFATLTSRVKPNSFVCHSYKKTRWGYPPLLCVASAPFASLRYPCSFFPPGMEQISCSHVITYTERFDATKLSTPASKLPCGKFSLR